MYSDIFKKINIKKLQKLCINKSTNSILGY